MIKIHCVVVHFESRGRQRWNKNVRLVSLHNTSNTSMCRIILVRVTGKLTRTPSTTETEEDTHILGRRRRSDSWGPLFREGSSERKARLCLHWGCSRSSARLASQSWEDPTDETDPPSCLEDHWDSGKARGPDSAHPGVHATRWGGETSA